MTTADEHGRMATGNGRENTTGLIPVQFGDLWCAFEALVVEEILGAARWVRLPGAKSELPGVLGWRGRAVAVLDLGVLAGLSEPAETERSEGRTIVARGRECTCAIPVDAAREVVEVERSAITTPVATNQRFASVEVELEEGLIVPVFDVGVIIDTVRPAPAGEAS